jgi:hypothetical protein
MSQSSAEPLPSSRTAPWNPIQALLKTVGSIWITVVTLVVLIAVLLWGTIVANKYGDTAARFGIYGSWWFNSIGVILGVNSAASLALRWPWRRQQLGFTLPHVGLIVLLVGCFISRRYGIEATVSIIEGQSSNRVYQGVRQRVELDDGQQFRLQVLSSDSAAEKEAPINVPFTSGPFNWEDFTNGNLSLVPWAVEHQDRWLGRMLLGLERYTWGLTWTLAHRDRGILFDHDGIRLEVLDYLSSSEVVHLPSVRVEATPSNRGEANGESKSFNLDVKADDAATFTPRQYGEGNEDQLPGGTRILFWMTGNEDETAAFQQSAPKGPLGKLGRVVLYAKGEAFDWPLDDWQPGSRRPLGNSGLQAELVDLAPDQGDVVVRLMIHDGDSVQRMALSSELPEKVNWQDYSDGVFGVYWLARSERTAKPKETPKPEAKKVTAKDGKAAKAKPDAANSKVEKRSDQEIDAVLANLPLVPPRVDFFQGADQKLYLRTWRDGEVKVVGPLRLAEGGGRITVFRGTPDEAILKFSDYQPADRPCVEASPQPFDKDPGYRLRQAKVRLTVDGKSDTFWVTCTSYDPEELRALRYSPDEIQLALKKNAVPRRFLHTVAGRGRRVVLGFEPQSFELGFAVHLNKAWQKLDPGSPTQAAKSFYASEIDLVPKLSEAELSAAGATKSPPKYENLLVTLNAPLDFTDPRSGKSFRLFQASMSQAYQPQEFGINLGEPVYVSGLSLNDDPGRGLTYLGCLMVVAGIFVAYFVRFAPPKRG